MANSKISALTSATTPLAGTEVLPIVQSSTTKKVAVSDLTAGRTVSAARIDTSNNAGGGVMSTFSSGWSNTTLSLQGSGTTGAAVFNVSNVAASAAYPLEVWMNGTKVYTFDTSGNLVPSTAAKGINFTANSAAAGMTSQLLNWYEEGTWTPVVSDAITGGNQATLSSSSGKYTRLGRQVTVSCRIVFSSISGMTTGNVLYVQGLPFTPGNALADRYTSNALLENITFTNNPYFVLDGNGAVFYLAQNISGGAASQIKVSQAANNTFIAGSITYFV